MKVLVTGATGFVGRALVPLLLQKGLQVHVLTHSKPAEDGTIAHPGELLSGQGIRQALQAAKPDLLIHLAWNAKPGQFWHAEDNVDWLAGSLRLYREAVDAGCRRICMAGSCAEQLSLAGTPPVPRLPPPPDTVYGSAKRALQTVLECSARRTGVSFSWVRLFFMFGPHEAPGRLVSDVTRSLLLGRPALCGSGKPQRDFLHVSDVAAAIQAVALSDIEGAVDIGAGSAVPIREVVETLADLIGCPDLLRIGARPDPSGEPARLVADTSLLARTGFRPRFDLSSGLADTVAWWRTRFAADGSS